MKKINLLFILLLLLATGCDELYEAGKNEVIVANGKKIKATTNFNPSSDSFTGYKYWVRTNMLSIKKNATGKVTYASDFVFGPDIIAGIVGEAFSFKKETSTTGVVTILYCNYNRLAGRICKIELPYIISSESKNIKIVGLSNYRNLEFFDDFIDLIAIDKNRIIFDICDLKRDYTRKIMNGANSANDVFYVGFEKDVLTYEEYSKLLRLPPQ